MKKLLFLGLIPMLFVVFASGCKSEHEKKLQSAEKMQKSINKVVVKEDFEKAHQYLGELLLLEPPTRDNSNYYKSMYNKQEASIRDVYLAEIRYLVAKNDESSWNRAYMLLMEVPDMFEETQMELFKALYDYAVEFDNNSIEEKTARYLGIIKEDKMIMPITTSISGPNNKLFAVVGNEVGNKLTMDKKQWSLTVEIKRIKNGDVVPEKRGYTSYYYIYVSLLDDYNAVIESGHAGSWDLQGLEVGDSFFLTFNGPYSDNIKTATKFKVYSKE